MKGLPYGRTYDHYYVCPSSREYFCRDMRLFYSMDILAELIADRPGEMSQIISGVKIPFKGSCAEWALTAVLNKEIWSAFIARPQELIEAFGHIATGTRYQPDDSFLAICENDKIRAEFLKNPEKISTGLVRISNAAKGAVDKLFGYHLSQPPHQYSIPGTDAFLEYCNGKMSIAQFFKKIGFEP